MSDVDGVLPKGDKIKKALQWIAEMQMNHPAIKRKSVLEKAQIRFNLSPRECEFLEKNFNTL